MEIVPDSMEIQSWKVNFQTEVCLKSADPHLTKHCIKDVEVAKPIDELMTSRSFVERHDFTHYDMLDAMIASALKKLLNTNVHFRNRVYCRRAARSKIRPILTRETICLHALRVFSCDRSL